MEMGHGSPVSCLPQPNTLTPCLELLPTSQIRVVLWVLLAIALVSNTLLILSKLIASMLKGLSSSSSESGGEESPVLDGEVDSPAEKEACPINSNKTPNHQRNFDFALCHLAFADLMTCIYLVIIVAYDWQTKGEFAASGAWWQQSGLCQLAGFFLVAGIQLGYFTVLVIGVQHYRLAMHPNSPKKHLTITGMCIMFCAAWVIALATAVVTLYSGRYAMSQDESVVLPPYNGAYCIPWGIEFPYAFALVLGHIIWDTVCVVMCFLAMFSAKKAADNEDHQLERMRLQTMVVIFVNIIFILPLALIGALASAVQSYPQFSNWWVTYVDYEPTSSLDVDILLLIVLLMISLRLSINPVVFITFNRQFFAGFCRSIGHMFCHRKQHSVVRNSGYDEDNTSSYNLNSQPHERFYPQPAAGFIPTAVTCIRTSGTVSTCENCTSKVVHHNYYSKQCEDESDVQASGENLHSSFDYVIPNEIITLQPIENLDIIPVSVEGFPESRVGNGLIPGMELWPAVQLCRVQDKSQSYSETTEDDRSTEPESCCSKEYFQTTDDSLDDVQSISHDDDISDVDILSYERHQNEPCPMHSQCAIRSSSRAVASDRKKPDFDSSNNNTSPTNNKLSQASCDSSASKDSGIQSEPDYTSYRTQLLNGELVCTCYQSPSKGTATHPPYHGRNTKRLVRSNVHMTENPVTYEENDFPSCEFDAEPGESTERSYAQAL